MAIFGHLDAVTVLSRPILVFRVAKVAQIRQVSQLEMLATPWPRTRDAKRKSCCLQSLHLCCLLKPLTAVFVSNGDRLSTLGAADLLVFHIESFCIHTAVLILTKGVLVSRSSRLIADKSSHGFLYPCDEPGRGGTCQISPWDHVFLGAFWAYNTGSVHTFRWC